MPTDAEVKAATACAEEVRLQEQGTPKPDVIDAIYKVIVKLLLSEPLDQTDRDSVPRQLAAKL
jgi:hypothetical protein